MVESGPRHGTPKKYDAGCRCERCKDANARRQRLKRARAKQREGTGVLAAVPSIASVEVPIAGGTSKKSAGPMEAAVIADLASYDRAQPGFNTLQASALALAREIDNVNSTAAKAPLVKQMVTIVRMLLGEDGDDDGLDDLLDDVAAAPTLAGTSDRDGA